MLRFADGKSPFEDVKFAEEINIIHEIDLAVTQGAIARIAAACTAWAERWIPDAFVFALAATFLVLVAAMSTGARPLAVLEMWGGGYWELLQFTLQMALIIITGYVVATTRPVYRVIAAVAALPKTPRGAVAMVAFFAMATSWLNWGFSLIFSAMLAKEVARRLRGVDYRAVAASSFLGLGSVWAQGLSGSAALQMATSSAMQEGTRAIVAGKDPATGKALIEGGIIPLSHTIFLWQSLVSVVVEVALVTLVVYLYAPPAGRARTAADLGIDLGLSPLDTPDPQAKSRTPGEWLEHARVLNLLFTLVAGSYLVAYFAQAPSVVQAITLNTINLTLLTVGFALHGTPARLMRAVREATPSVWGVILQFPFYAGIAAVIGFFFVFEHTFEVLYDLRDVDGDRAVGVPTYPVVHGPRVSASIVYALCGLSVVPLVAARATSSINS